MVDIMDVRYTDFCLFLVFAIFLNKKTKTVEKGEFHELGEKG